MILSGIAFCVALSSVGSAYAEAESREDAQGDNAGDYGERPLLDIRSISHENAVTYLFRSYSTRDLALIVETYDDWDNSLVESKDSCCPKVWISFQFTGEGEGGCRCYLTIFRNPDDSLYGEMSRYTAEDGQLPKSIVRVWRPSATQLQVQFPREALSQNPEKLTGYTWSVSTNTVGCWRGYRSPVTTNCFDVAPDGGPLHHSLLECSDGLDNDGDGQSDSSDPACAHSVDTNESHITFSTRMAIERSSTVLEGSVVVAPKGADPVDAYDSSYAARCLAGRPVHLYKKGSQPPTTSYGEARLDSDGRWTMGIAGLDGRYWVRIDPWQWEMDRDLVTCETARSRVLRLGE